MGSTSASAHAAEISYALVAIPLSRPHVRGFLRDWHVPARGADVSVLEQRPSPRTRTRWLRGLTTLDDDPELAVSAILSTDDAMAHVGTTRTDRLVPRHLLDDDGYLERNLGGWAPLWFDAMGVADPRPSGDPLLEVAERIVDYGARIPSLTVAPELIVDRLPYEFGDIETLRRGAELLLRARMERGESLVSDLVAAARGDGPLAGRLHVLLIHDELLEQLYRLETARREARAEERTNLQRRLSDRQRAYADELGVELMLKGEYIMGRHRRSTILLAEGIGVVVKQPAPEPEHDIELAARTYDGLGENWPRPEGRGRMVTARADVAQVVDSTAVERLNGAFGRDVRFSAALGLSVEPFEEGPTLAALARERHEELTARRYDEILLHHLACEELGIDNPDWHAANFMVTREGLVHIDWGAARPIEPDEDTPQDARDRLDQVRELAWSFHDVDLAQRTSALHARAVGDPEHMERLRARARRLVG